MQIRVLSLGLALLGAALPALAASTSEEARLWIERMNKAVVERSYDGVLEHHWYVGGGGVEALRIIHRKQGGVLTERVMLLGSSYETIRNGTQLLEFDRRKGFVKAQTLTRSYGYLAAFNGVSADSEKHYEITKGGLQRLPDYPGQTQLITIRPRDELRYGYRFWLDQQSAMPIKTQLVSAGGVVFDEIYFQSLSMPDSISDELVRPDVLFKPEELFKSPSGKGPKWFKPDAPATAVKLAFLPRAELLPPGFRQLPFKAPESKQAGAGPETRFIVSDGVNWVAVTVSVADRPLKEGLRQSATAFQYLLLVKGHYISVTGEVPPATVQLIAKAVLPE